ncbi:hypothetical protein KCP70_10980 [Salmonella enterica subsp. enterica]|nr:hypothetical protein KCP70_10980 [Salmonella enterica subsp. enterica]
MAAATAMAIPAGRTGSLAIFSTRIARYQFAVFPPAHQSRRKRKPRAPAACMTSGATLGAPRMVILPQALMTLFSPVVDRYSASRFTALPTNELCSVRQSTANGGGGAALFTR